jgi:hypothetical protein
MPSKALKKRATGKACAAPRTAQASAKNADQHGTTIRAKSSTAIAIEYLAMLPEPTLGPPPPDKLRTAWLRYAEEEELRRVSVIEARLWRKRQTEIELLAELKTIRQRCCRRKERKDKKKVK